MLPRIAMLFGASMLAVLAFGQKPLAYSSVPFPALTGASLGAIADFNGDGKLDIVLTGGAGQLQLLLGNGDGTFRQGPPLPIASGNAAAGDFNGDGKPDLAVCFSTAAQPAQLQILINQGNGTFRQGQLLPVCNGQLLIADFNGDGKLDIYDSGVRLWLGNGDGTFTGPTVYNPPLPLQPVIGDFNGDRLLDLADIVGGDLQHQAEIWLNQGGGRFGSTPELAVNFTTASGSTNTDSLVAGDFNGDGRADLAFLVPTGQLNIFLALSENLTDRPLLRNFLHPLNREEPTLVTAIRLAR